MQELPYSQYPSTYYRVSLKAIIRNDRGEVLVNREHGHTNWSLPGGGIDHGEDEIVCLKRELYEEVGYKGELTAHPVATSPMYLPSHQAWLLWIVYAVKTENMDFSVGVDGEDLKFVDPTIFKDSDARAEQLIYKFCAVDKVA